LIARIGILVFGPAFKEQKEAREQMQYVLLVDYLQEFTDLYIGWLLKLLLKWNPARWL
jgi:hypothetical protein